MRSPTSIPRRVLSVGSLAGAILVVGLAFASAAAARQLDRCPEGLISDIFIDNHSVFDPASIPDDPRIRWAYRLANRIHVRTRRDFIESELLVERGSCVDPLLVRESARTLREFRFIADADAYTVRQPNGMHHLIVETRDEWTTKFASDIVFEDGLELRGMSLTEENFLGRGVTLGAFWLEVNERREVGAIAEVPRLGGSDWDTGVSASRTRVGEAWSQVVIHPFVGEVGTFAARQRLHGRRDLFTWTLPDGEAWSHLTIPMETRGGEFTIARRIGAPGRLFLVGGGLSHERVRPGTLDEVEGVADGDFDARVPAPPEVSEWLAPQLLAREATRLNLVTGIRRIDFVQRIGLDALAGTQDIAVGREVLLTGGPSLGGSGESDLFLRGDLFGGAAGRSSIAQLHLSAEGRRLRSTSGGSATRDILGELHLFLYRRIEGSVPQTFVLRATAQGGWRTETPFQLTLGGPDGVRGYGEEAFPGARRIVVSVEDRLRLPSPFPDLFDLGATLFADGGRMLPGDAPFGTDSGWRGTVGAGLRVGFPAGSAAVIRADLAFPVGPGSGGSPRLLIQAREWIGILHTFRSPDLADARRSGVNPRFTGVSRIPR